jgi:hypothetical protein
MRKDKLYATGQRAPVGNTGCWGSHTLSIGEVGHWRIGPSELWIHRFEREWRVAHKQLEDPFDNSLEVEVPAATKEGEEEGAVYRFSFRKTSTRVALTPALADRPIIIRPETPFTVPAGEDINLYLSTPIWLQIKVGDPPKFLAELPGYRPSDTWFGPSTREGELCYASRTTGRLRLEDVDFLPHRSITVARLRNRAKDALVLERIRLPVQYLSLYSTSTGHLWTETVTLTRQVGGDLAELQIGRGAPSEAGKAERIATARQQPEAGLVVRTFSRFFGSR